uniref:Uncharacterized protein n=1 Tax=Panagrolaimus sp. PS1159 TaxID=55785 RepID=A0AC35G923_9BILA
MECINVKKMSEHFFVKFSFWERTKQTLYNQEQEQHLKFFDINIYGFFVFWTIANFELFLLVFMLFTTFISCCKKKNREQKNFGKPSTDPPTETDDLNTGLPAAAVQNVNGNIPPPPAAGVNGKVKSPATTTNTAANANAGTTTIGATTTECGGTTTEAGTKSKADITKASKEKTKSHQMKTAKATPKNVWELAYPPTTETIDGETKE